MVSGKRQKKNYLFKITERLKKMFYIKLMQITILLSVTLYFVQLVLLLLLFFIRYTVFMKT